MAIKRRLITLGRTFKLTGALFLGYHLMYAPGMGIYNHFIREPYNLKERYGDNSWVVVTGASDGIGKELAREFAKKGFNLYLVSRTEEKLKQIAEDYEKDYKIQVKYLAKDFTKAADDGFFDDITEHTKDLDVAVLVNNVGMGGGNRINETSKDKLKNALTVNIFPQVMMTHEFVPRMLKRKEKSAIVNLASIMADQPFAVSPTYSSTKVFNDYFSRATAHEYADKIDIMSVRPGYVSTPLTDHKKLGLDTITPEDCASEVIKKLGYDRWTGGHWRHALQNHLVLQIPDTIFQPYFSSKKKKEQKKD